MALNSPEKPHACPLPRGRMFFVCSPYGRVSGRRDNRLPVAGTGLHRGRGRSGCRSRSASPWALSGARQRPGAGGARHPRWRHPCRRRKATRSFRSSARYLPPGRSASRRTFHSRSARPSVASGLPVSRSNARASRGKALAWARSCKICFLISIWAYGAFTSPSSAQRGDRVLLLKGRQDGYLANNSDNCCSAHDCDAGRFGNALQIRSCHECRICKAIVLHSPVAFCTSRPEQKATRLAASPGPRLSSVQ